MNIRKQWVLRIIAGALLIILAGGVSYTVRQLLASRHPEAALPTIHVVYNNTDLPHEHYMMSSYSWRFLTQTLEWADEPDAYQRMAAAPVLPNIPLDVNFSTPCKTLKISRTGADNQDFQEIVADSLHTPAAPGEYTYRVEAGWGRNGAVLYYIKVRVQD